MCDLARFRLQQLGSVRELCIFILKAKVVLFQLGYCLLCLGFVILQGIAFRHQGIKGFRQLQKVTLKGFFCLLGPLHRCLERHLFFCC